MQRGVEGGVCCHWQCGTDPAAADSPSAGGNLCLQVTTSLSVHSCICIGHVKAPLCI